MPQLAFLWGRSAADFNDIYPLAIEPDITTVLSTDVGEGRSSMPIRRVARGASAMIVNRLLVVLVTADVEDAGTSSQVDMLLTARDGNSNVFFIAGQDSSPARLRRAEVALFMLPTIQAFTRNDLRSISLRIHGEDLRVVRGFFVFGLDDETGRPESIVPLLHEAVLPPELFALSTDEDEGVRAAEFQSIVN